MHVVNTIHLFSAASETAIFSIAFEAVSSLLSMAFFFGGFWGLRYTEGGGGMDGGMKQEVGGGGGKGEDRRMGCTWKNGGRKNEVG